VISPQDLGIVTTEPKPMILMGNIATCRTKVSVFDLPTLGKELEILETISKDFQTPWKRDERDFGNDLRDTLERITGYRNN
jgi:hypothetical protein